MTDFAIFSGNSNPVLVKKICDYLNVPMGGAKVKTFSDGEIQIEINENVRLKDIFVVQSTCQPVNDNLVELLLMIDAFNRSSARRITAVIPYFGYARQDRRPRDRANAHPRIRVMFAAFIQLHPHRAPQHGQGHTLGPHNPLESRRFSVPA